MHIMQDVRESMWTGEVDCVDGVEYFAFGDVVDSETIDTWDWVCSSCDFSLGATETEAIAWLKEHNMLGEDDEKCQIPVR